MARTDPQVNLRIPAELKEKLQDTALASNRSLNAEVVARLESSFSQPDDGDVVALTRTISRLETNLTVNEATSNLYRLTAQIQANIVLDILKELPETSPAVAKWKKEIGVSYSLVKSVQDNDADEIERITAKVRELGETLKKQGSQGNSESA